MPQSTTQHRLPWRHEAVQRHVPRNNKTNESQADAHPRHKYRLAPNITPRRIVSRLAANLSAPQSRRAGRGVTWRSQHHPAAHRWRQNLLLVVEHWPAEHYRRSSNRSKCYRIKQI